MVLLFHEQNEHEVDLGQIKNGKIHLVINVIICLWSIMTQDAHIVCHMKKYKSYEGKIFNITFLQ